MWGDSCANVWLKFRNKVSSFEASEETWRTWISRRTRLRSDVTPSFVELHFDYLRFFVITEITLFSECMPIATWRLYARPMIYSGSTSRDLDVTTVIGICFVKRCFLFAYRCAFVASNQPRITIRLRAYETNYRRAINNVGPKDYSIRLFLYRVSWRKLGNGDEGSTFARWSRSQYVGRIDRTHESCSSRFRS